jgi:hypothetical protein
VDRARVLIEDYLYLQNPDFDFRLRVQEFVFDNESISNILKLALKDGRKAQYDREKCTLTMSRPIHDTISLLVSGFLIKAVNTGFFTPEESGYIRSGAMAITLSRTTTYQSHKKPIAWRKHPDSVIYFCKTPGESIPRIVFEVGFSQLHEDFISDAG